ncbi:chemotaxis protein CheB [Tengunoibacter tsumagoiensis]|uniref:histidine kinase n=1 Tax=Tengunoibacter tsumagoiensis TaxID=2014871 RepID=A0A401ZXP2_9CHLR|nr:chemotaxis protein CheB [Tengunoibacter tsumagoiensis]GCE11607.1 sensor histidine kinase [Tengunoibacter tsumagoiensis]
MLDRGKDLDGPALHDQPARDQPAKESFRIVGIGASAGGLEAFTQLLSHLPSVTGMAYIFVQHLDPNHQSILPDLLARVTRIPVYVIQDLMRVEPDHVYVIPPNVDLIIEQRTLRLLPRTQQGGQHLTIDRFFRSLATDQKQQAIGVVLSGTASDGTAGLQAIHEQGGMTFAQTIESSAYPQMPQHAIASNCVDQILSPEGIALELQDLIEHPYFETLFPLEPDRLSVDELQAFTVIRQLLCEATGVDFLAYRMTTLQRRILRRMAVVQVDQFLAYSLYLKDHPSEMEALSQEVLIHVTRFFRNQSAFEAITRVVFPGIVPHLLPGNPIRIWIAGCSTGEEVYSLAILLLEFRETHGLALPFQIFATDIDTGVLKQARAGIYQRKALQDVSSERLQRFFLPLDRSGERYQVNASIREQCVFARHNLAYDPPFSRLDLLSCRNVLIYLMPSAQEKVLQTLHYALKPHGFLVLGASESVGPDSGLFTRVEPHQKIFTKKSWKQNFLPPVIGPGDDRVARPEGVKKEVQKMLHMPTLQQEAERLLLTTYAPACVVLDADLQILHLRGNTNLYLEPVAGKATFHVLKWAREGLKLGLRATILAAQKEDRPVSRDQLRLSNMNNLVRITVVPLKASSLVNGFLVIFEDDGPVITPTLLSNFLGRGARRDGAARIAVLEQELAKTWAEVQLTLDADEKANVSLQEANEEVHSSNEELQSINEELETSQAEVQAINEELTSTNQELQTRNEQLRIAQDYAESIVETVREPLVVLNADMRVQSANTSFYTFFHVVPPQVIQRTLWELGNGQWDRPDVHRLIQEAQDIHHTFHDIEVEHDFPTIGHRVVLLSGRSIISERKGTRDHLILLAIEDITARKELERQKETLLSMVSHELNTPLTSAKGFVQLLQRRMKKAEDQQMVSELVQIDGSLDRLSDLIRGLLDESALEAGMFSIHPDTFVVNDLVQEVIKEQQSIWPDRIRLETLTSIRAYADRERTGQVLRNLLSNALKYSPIQEPVWVSVQVIDAIIQFSVQNQGKGIPQDQQARIFERFVRIDAPEHHAVKGMGLGLYIAAQIVRQQGGKIWVESAPNQGATFFFTLSLAE